jgi:hypothetical protein
MNRISFSYLVTLFSIASFFMVLASCSVGKQSPIRQLEELTEDIRLYHQEYTTADWKEAYARYEQIAAEMEKYQYSKEEAEMIGKMEGECVGYFMKSAVKSLDGLESEIKGFFDGLENAVK